MAEDQEKKETPEAPKDKCCEPAPQGSKVVGWLIVLVLAIIVVQIVYFINSSRTQAPVVPEGPPGQPAETAAPAGGGPPPSQGAVSGSAVSGNIRIDRLIAGIVKLEGSSTPLTVQQARELRKIVAVSSKKQMAIGYLSDKLDGVLTAPQKDFLKKQIAQAGTKPVGFMQPETLKIVKDKLVGVAKQGISNAIEIPEDPPGEPPVHEPGKPYVPSLFAFVNLYDLLEQKNALAVNADQAKKILPILNAYSPPEDARRHNEKLLGVLTREQKEQIDKVLKSLPDKPQAMLEYADKLDKILDQKAK
jgi:hypothetical protein